MAKIDVKFAKGNQQTVKAMSTTYKDKKPKTKTSKTSKK